MRWQGRRGSDNVEDQRGSGGALPGGKSMGLGAVVLTLIALYFGVDPAVVLNGLPGGKPASTPSSEPRPSSPQTDQLAQFVAVVLADTEDTWRSLFQQMNKKYQDPKLVLFTDSVQSACGQAGASVGPFYCPGDHKIYIDLSFYQALKDRFKAPGDFAQAYVIAHEVGHHVQNLLGISSKIHELRKQASAAASNQLSVRQELQADCLAGVWAHHTDKTKHILEEGDVAEAMNAASSIGDDRLQKQAQGRVAPDTFTHGSSEQRMRWFNRGISEGKLSACDTFSAKSL